jgi:16S rRNA (uracil1498-N3)-methyltransferase
MRRIHVQEVLAGDLALDAAETHHVRDVLRLDQGTAVEVFDDTGRTAQGILTRCAAGQVIVRVGRVRPAPAEALEWTVASAIPKGARADWMIEKLTELGTAAFVPLATARGVVLPAGKAKRQRWVRLSTEAAKQSHRIGVMRIDDLTDVRRYVAALRHPGWCFCSCDSAVPIGRAAAEMAHPNSPPVHSLSLLIGPEGGWTSQELAAFETAGLTPVSLGATILRIETAAVAAAAVVAAVLVPALRLKLNG